MAQGIDEKPMAEVRYRITVAVQYSAECGEEAKKDTVRRMTVWNGG